MDGDESESERVWEYGTKVVVIQQLEGEIS
jgi:hypothetical protein